jgi:hypothetical protein
MPFISNVTDAWALKSISIFESVRLAENISGKACLNFLTSRLSSRSTTSQGILGQLFSYFFSSILYFYFI